MAGTVGGPALRRNRGPGGPVRRLAVGARRAGHALSPPPPVRGRALGRRDFLAFLEFAVDAEGDRGRLIVATCRPSLLDAAPAWAAGRPEQDRHVLDLSPLSQATAIEL